MMHEALVLYGDMLSGFGAGATPFLDALYEGRSAFRPITRFPVGPDRQPLAACFPDGLISCAPGETLAFCTMKRLADALPPLPPETRLFFAFTTGDAELLENAENRWTAELLAERTAPFFNCRDVRIYSGACASSGIALARAAQRVAEGKDPCILVVACDLVSEFTYSGFSAVGAMTPSFCRPYDRDHDGLLLGDAAAAILIGSRETARKTGLRPLAAISGAGFTSDAYHVTAPAPSGECMVRAVRTAMGDRMPEEIGGVIGHGTGTVLNDDMEIRVLQKIFPGGLPLASVKGALGHILAASGAVQILAAAEALKRGKLFPQTSLITPAPGAERFVSSAEQRLRAGRLLSLNAGMGGLNSVLLLERIAA